MPLPGDNTEYCTAPAALPTDTLVDSVLMLLGMTAVQRLVGLVRAVLFCRWLDPEQLGLWDMTFSFLVMAAPLSVLAIPGVFGRYAEHYRRQGRLRVFLRRTALVCTGLALVAGLTVVLARRWFSALMFGTEDRADLVVLAAGCLLLVVAYNFLTELFTALRNIRLVSTMQFVNSVAFAVLGVALLMGWRCTASSVVLGFGASCAIAAAPALWMLWRTWRASPPVERMPDAAFWPKLAPFAAWVLAGSVLTNLFGVIDRYLIVHCSGASAGQVLDMVGNYHASRVVPVLLYSIAVMLGAMVLPHLTHDWEAGRRQQVAARLRLFLKLFGLGLFAAAVAVVVAAPLLFEVAFRGKFPGGQAILPWTLLFGVWLSLAAIAQSYLLCAEKARLPSLALLCGLVISVALNLELLPRWGLPGAALATAAANGVTLWLICLFNRTLGFRLDDGSRLVLLLPMAICAGPRIAVIALLAVGAEAVWGRRLFSAEEKRQLADSMAEYGKRFGLARVIRRLTLKFVAEK
jgi:polysaccharide transporter, PST family